MKFIKSFSQKDFQIKTESFMNSNYCDRCKIVAKQTTMSIFNQDIICINCKEKEKKDPEYKAASLAELQALRRGDANYKGAILNYTPILNN